VKNPEKGIWEKNNVVLGGVIGLALESREFGLQGRCDSL